jgi:hypothetical protein
MEITFCAAPGCHDVAVGHGYWQGRRGIENPQPRRPADMCRAHHAERIEGDLVRCEVLGDSTVTDVRTGKSVGRGGIVELDPVETHIAGLVYAGHVKVVPAAKAAAKASKE